MRRAVLAILLVVFVILSAAAGGVIWWLGRVAPNAELLVQQADGNLLLVTTRGEGQPLTGDANGRTRFYGHPVPSPDGRSIAYVKTVHNIEEVASALVIHRLNGTPRTVFDSYRSHPFYLHWSPDGRNLAFLASDRNGMVLRNVNTVGEPVTQEVVPGQPSYFSWTPDSHRLLLHTGGSAPNGSLSLWQVGDDEPQPLAVAPAMFQAPAWVEDGQAAIAVIRDSGAVTLVRLDQQGAIQQRLATADSGMLFVTAPDGKEVAYMRIDRRSFGNLRIVGTDGTGDREVTTDPVVTFFWSPDGTRIAFLAEPDEGIRTVASPAEQEITLAWYVLDVASGEVGRLNTFVPSDEFLNLLPFFDQYAQSIRLWDKTSGRLVYADRAGVWTLDVETGATTKVSDGVLGMWIER